MRDVRKRVRGETLGARRSATAVGLLIISILLPVLACLCWRPCTGRSQADDV